MSRTGNAVGTLIGLLFGTLILFYLDPVVAQAFNSALADPAFANSAPGAAWRILAFVFSFHLDIIAMWIGFLKANV
jgi:protein-S-isoprenylcysteine O-methyltransferase Ste14